jgi:hypothetical protein
MIVNKDGVGVFEWWPYIKAGYIYNISKEHVGSFLIC